MTYTGSKHIAAIDFPRCTASSVAGLALLCGAALWAIYVHYSVPVLPYDDGYITFRYVDNLLRGGGLVYNPGQNVFGSTTPLYVLLLAMAKWSSHQAIPDLAVRLNIIPFLLCGVGIYCLVRRWTSSAFHAGICASVFLVSLDMLVVSSGGMETFFFLALVLFTFWVLEAQPPRAPWAGVLSGLAILTRPEGILLIPIGVLIFRKSMRNIVKFMALLSLPVAPWVLFATMKYGTPIPMSLIAKSRGVYPLGPGDALLMMVTKVADWAQIETPISYHVIFGKLNHLFAPRMILLILLLIISAWACAKYSARSGKKAWLPSLYLLLLLILYGFGNPFIFEWYMPPVYVCVLLSLLVGLPLAGRLAGDRISKHKEGFAPWLFWAGATALALTCMVFPLFNRYRATGLGIRAPIEAPASDPERLRVLAYRKAAEVLNAIDGPDAVIAAPEIGALGFYSRARILDTCGLISPEVHRYLPVPADQRLGPHLGVIGVEMVRDLKPDFVVSMPVFFERSLSKSVWFEENYTRIHAVLLPKECWGSKEIFVFAKKPAL